MSEQEQQDASEGGIGQSASTGGLGRMTVDEIEGCFPERGATTDDDSIICSAQWLHDFAHNVAALEREACAKICDRLATMMEQGAGELEPSGRLRQAARTMRSN